MSIGERGDKPIGTEPFSTPIGSGDHQTDMIINEQKGTWQIGKQGKEHHIYYEGKKISELHEDVQRRVLKIVKRALSKVGNDLDPHHISSTKITQKKIVYHSLVESKLKITATDEKMQNTFKKLIQKPDEKKYYKDDKNGLDEISIKQINKDNIDKNDELINENSSPPHSMTHIDDYSNVHQRTNIKSPINEINSPTEEKKVSSHSDLGNTNTNIYASSFPSVPTEYEPTNVSEKVKNVLLYLINDLGLKTREDGFLYRGNINTGQKIEELGKSLETAFKVEGKAQTDLIGIRLKGGRRQLKKEDNPNAEKHEHIIVHFDRNGKHVDQQQKTKLLGKGAFGKVYNYEAENKDVAVKFPITSRDDYLTNEEEKKLAERSINDVLNEGEKLNIIGHTKGVQHPPKMITVIQGFNRNAISKENKIGYLGVKYSGDAKNIKNWSPKELINGFCDLIEGLHSCHQKGIYLGDIKSTNIFRDDKNKELRLGDFGGAFSKMDSIPDEFGRTNSFIHESDKKVIEKIEELPTEERNSKINEYAHTREKMDVYALGISLYEMVGSFQDPPWDYETRNSDKRLSEGTIQKNLMNGRLNGCNPNLAQGLAKMIFKMLDPNTKQRPAITDVLHNFASLRQLNNNS